MRLVRRRCSLLGSALAIGLACFESATVFAQATELSCDRPGSHKRFNQTLIDPTFSRPLNLFQQAGSGPPEQATAFYERAAAELDAAIASHPNHPQAALANFYVALAFERSGRTWSAMERYRRIIREYNTTRDAAGHELTGEDRTQRINILEMSTFRAAVMVQRDFDFDEAIRLYRLVVSDTRFAHAADHAEHVRDAIAAIAILERRPHHPTRAASPNDTNGPTRWPNTPPDTLAMEAMSYATRLTVLAP